MSSQTSTAKIPQALATGYPSRLRLEQTSLFISTQPVTRTTKRAAASVVSYTEIEEDYDEDDDQSGYGFMNGGGDMERKEKEVKKPRQKTQHVQYSERQMAEQSEREEILVPLRLALEYEDYRITDFFMWNLNEEVITPEQFAAITCKDLDLPVGFLSVIENSIKNQLSEYRAVANIKLPPEAGLRVVINLSVNLDKKLYEDKFEWDLGADLTAESFAKTVVQDLGLAGEFYPAIAHAVHEQLLRMKKEAIDGHLPQEIDNLAAFNQEAGWRMDQELLGEEWVPTVEILSQEEIERREIERERNIRRLKRESMRMGDQITDIGGMFGRNKRARTSRRYDGDSPSRGASPAVW